MLSSSDNAFSNFWESAGMNAANRGELLSSLAAGHDFATYREYLADAYVAEAYQIGLEEDACMYLAKKKDWVETQKLKNKPLYPLEK